MGGDEAGLAITILCFALLTAAVLFQHIVNYLTDSLPILSATWKCYDLGLDVAACGSCG